MPFEVSAPTFFNEYQASRVVVDSKHGRMASNMASAPSTTAKAA